MAAFYRLSRPDGEAWDFFDEASAVGDNNRPRAMTATPIQDAIANLAV